MSANFSAVWKDCGFLAGTPPFLVIPREGIGLVYLNGVRSLDVNRNLKFDGGSLAVRPVSPSDLQRNLLRYARNFPSDALGDVLSLSIGMQNTIRFGSTLLAVEARVSGRTISLDYVAKADRAKMDVYASSRTTIAVSFRFARYQDATGQLKGGTTLVPSYADELVRILNRLYLPSANIELRLKSSQYVDLAQKLGDSISQNNFLQDIAPRRDAGADMTVFFVGKYRGTDDPLGQAFPDINCAVVDDSPLQYLAPQTAWPGASLTDEQVDSLVSPTGRAKSDRDLHVVLAHEIAHLLGAGHNNDPDNLMSMNRQDFKFSKDTVRAVSPN
jgi:Matrixin